MVFPESDGIAKSDKAAKSDEMAVSRGIRPSEKPDPGSRSLQLSCQNRPESSLLLRIVTLLKLPESSRIVFYAAFSPGKTGPGLNNVEFREVQESARITVLSLLSTTLATLPRSYPAQSTTLATLPCVHHCSWATLPCVHHCSWATRTCVLPWATRARVLPWATLLYCTLPLLPATRAR